MYGAAVSKQTIFTINNKMIDEMAEWQNDRWTRCIR